MPVITVELAVSDLQLALVDAMRDPMPREEFLRLACEIGLALHAMVTRRTNVFDPVVLTLGKIAGLATLQDDVLRQSRESVFQSFDVWTQGHQRLLALLRMDGPTTGRRRRGEDGRRKTGQKGEAAGLWLDSGNLRGMAPECRHAGLCF